MNPFFGRGSISPFQNMQTMMQQINMIRQNPNQLAQFLLNQNKITKQQFDEIQQMGIGGNPQAIGNYLMQNGVLNQQQVQDAYNNSVQPLQNSIKQN